jgi:putative transposase
MTIRNELIDELLAGQDPSSVMRQDGLLGELKKALLNRLMAAEFDHHLTQDCASGESKNHRSGSTRKRVLTDDSHVEVTIPREPGGGRCHGVAGNDAGRSGSDLDGVLQTA